MSITMTAQDGTDRPAILGTTFMEERQMKTRLIRAVALTALAVACGR